MCRDACHSRDAGDGMQGLLQRPTGIRRVELRQVGEMGGARWSGRRLKLCSPIPAIHVRTRFSGRAAPSVDVEQTLVQTH